MLTGFIKTGKLDSFLGDGMVIKLYNKHPYLTSKELYFLRDYIVDESQSENSLEGLQYFNKYWGREKSRWDLAYNIKYSMENKIEFPGAKWKTFLKKTKDTDIKEELTQDEIDILYKKLT